MIKSSHFLSDPEQVKMWTNGFTLESVLFTCILPFSLLALPFCCRLFLSLLDFPLKETYRALFDGLGPLLYGPQVLLTGNFDQCCLYVVSSSIKV